MYMSSNSLWLRDVRGREGLYQHAACCGNICWKQQWTGWWSRPHARQLARRCCQNSTRQRWQDEASCPTVILFSWEQSAVDSKSVCLPSRRGAAGYSILVNIHETQNYWLSGLCLSSGILNTTKHISETWSVSVLRCGRGGGTYSVGSFRKSQVSRCLHPLTWGWKQIKFLKCCVFLYLEFRTINGQSPETQ
jgi:hypothetical protein